MEQTAPFTCRVFECDGDVTTAGKSGNRKNGDGNEVGTNLQTTDCVRDLKDLVELVGIEPTTSSLRILNPVRDDATPKKSE
jgi:hypothetical protein